MENSFSNLRLTTYNLRLFSVVGCLLLVVSCLGCGDIDTEISSLTVSPPSSKVGINQSQLFSVVAKDSLGRIVAVTPSWSVTGGVGSVTSTGIFTAGSSSGVGSVVASYGSLSDSSSVTVTEEGWVAGRVIDSKGYKVESMKVYLGGYKSTLLDFSDSDGDYSISSVPAGTYEVWTNETSVYRASSAEVTVASGETETVNFTILYFTDPPDLNPPEFSFD